MAETPQEIVDRELREFKRYTGDGLPGEPVNAPLPVGDPTTGVWNPKKKNLRNAMKATLKGAGEAVGDAEDQASYAQEWAQSPNPISVEAGGDGVSDRSAKFWAEQSSLIAIPDESIAASKIAYVLAAADAATRSLADKLGEMVSVKDFENADGQRARGDGKRLWADATISAGSPDLTVVGADFTADDVGKLIIVSGAGASGADLVTAIAACTNAENITLTDNAGTTITATETLVRYGTDDTDALLAAIAHTVATLPNVLFVPKGNYFYTGLGNLRHDGFKVVGSGMMSSILTYAGAGGVRSAALLMDAFPGSEVNPFIQHQHWSGLTIEAHSNVSHGIRAQGLSRSVLEDINVRECSVTVVGGTATDRHAIFLQGCMLNRFVGVYVSTNLQPMSAVPFGGVYVTEGRRNGISIGQSTNNVIMHCYWEGLTVGVNYHQADGNLMIGGSPEACSQYGLIVQSACRFNTFMGVGFENLGATRDVSDSGIFSHYINCYSSEGFLMQGRGTIVKGGFFERVDFAASAVRCSATDLQVNHWNTGGGGLVNASQTSTYKNIYDSDAGAYITLQPARQGITVGASPFLWSNNTGMTVHVVLQAGTVAEVVRNFGVSPWTLAPETNVEYTLRPGDNIRIGYSDPPSMSYYINTGYQG
ncbi:hypothetical protein [Pelagibacterium mangrovi]|uniref:hypothetical protein n=1 Tax=Pelagibacterium mangrovi TaxID=3119828 RepID=UPI002FCA9831